VELSNKRKTTAINFDHAATTPPFTNVDKKIRCELNYYGSIGRGKGQKSEHSTDIYVNGREIVKNFVSANDDYTVFYTNSTTEGMNKLASALIQSPDDIVLTTRMEHHANDLPWRERAKVIYADVDELGRLKISEIEKLLKEYAGRIKYVTVTAASNTTGYINDVHKIARLAHSYGALIIVDGAQIVAHRQFKMVGNAKEENIDFFVFSAHKMYSPYGGGAVVGLKAELNKHIPSFYGGGMVKNVTDNEVFYVDAPDSYEAGSPNYPGVVGMLEAIKTLEKIGFDYIEQHEQKLLKRLICGLKNIPGLTLYADNENIADRVGILVFNIDPFSPEEVANYLAGQHAIAVRHAAFCAHSYVRRLTGEAEVPGSDAPPIGMVRVSFGLDNNEEEVDCFISAICQLSKLSKKGDATNFLLTTLTSSSAINGRPFDRG